MPDNPTSKWDVIGGTHALPESSDLFREGYRWWRVMCVVAQNTVTMSKRQVSVDKNEWIDSP